MECRCIRKHTLNSYNLVFDVCIANLAVKYSAFSTKQRIYVIRKISKINTDYFPIQNKLADLYDVCILRFLRSTNWMFEHNLK